MSHTIDDAIRHATTILGQTEHNNARLEAELLLTSVLKKNRTWLRTWPDKILSPAQQQAFEKLILRRQNGEPIAYILGQRDFWTLTLTVTSDTLIPRPETELLLEQALARIPVQASWTILDLGTGSGAIAIALAKERPCCHVIGTDRSLAALRIARQNAHSNDVSNIHFLTSNWLTSFAGNFQAHMILSNPPYIKVQDPHLSIGDLRFEPPSALAAGREGLDDLQQIIREAKKHLKPEGWLLLEHGYQQQAALAALLAQQGYQSIDCYRDYADQPRLSLGQWRAN
ncbi:Peptide chain release factor N(5)-glutamine methyltransferase [hydrothermal vent metagenome]|uniref:Peptide chain release factor N(5)-glutamine methyltransferase n=1 Tax=hydrothermal vent metagenome TaxID=652676 RepID=A0A3B1BT68_9ZZZZ